MTTRRLLVPAATAVAVVVIATGAGVIANRRGHDAPAASPHVGSPTLPPLTVGSGREATAAGMALGAPAANASGVAGKIAAPVPGNGAPAVVVKGALPTATDALVPAYRLLRRTATSEEVVRLAAAFGLKATPKQQGGGWLVGDSKRYLAVDPTPGLDRRLLPGDVACGSIGYSGSAAGSGGTVGQGTAVATAVPPPGMPDAQVGSAVAPAAPVKPSAVDGGAPNPNGPPAAPPASAPAGRVAPDKPPAAGSEDPAATPIPGPCADGTVSSGVACAAPEGAKTLVACPTPTAKPVASEEAARAAALAQLEALGVHAEAGDVRVDEGYDGVRHVSVRRRVESRPVDGMNYELGIDATGAVVSASGLLATPVLAGEYPMLPPAELAQTLANTRVRMMLCLQKPGVEGCAPPAPIVVTGASVGLTLAMPADYDKGEAYLLPAWLFTIEGDPQPTAVVAVPDKYRTDPVPPAADPGTGVGKGGGIKPMPPEPAVPPASDLPAPASDLPAPSKDMPQPPAIGLPLPQSDWTMNQSAMAALIEGTLVLDSEGCLGVRDDRGDHPTVLVWPAGYTAERTAGSVVVKSNEGSVVARSGERFSAGGGSVGLPSGPVSAGAACDTRSGFDINDPGPYND